MGRDGDGGRLGSGLGGRWGWVEGRLGGWG